MGAVMRYAAQEKKTFWEEQQLVTGVNCRPESAYDDFMRTKLLYHKDEGTMYYHMVQSFPVEEEVDPVTAHAAAVELANWFEGREVLVCTHVDRDHIHSHFIINSVSLEDGKKLHISRSELEELRRRNDQVCTQFDLPVFQTQEKKKTKSISNAEYHAAAKGQSWKFQMINTIDECMHFAKSRDEFIALMRSEGYEVRWSASRKNITYTTPDGHRCRDDRLHDERYLKEAMEREFRIRQTAFSGRTETAQSPETDAVAGYDPDTGGLEGAAEYDRDSICSPVSDRVVPGGEQYQSSSEFHAAPGGRTVEYSAEDGAPARTGWEEERTALFTSANLFSYARQDRSHNAAHVAGGLVHDLSLLGKSLEHLEQSDAIDPAPIHIDKKRWKQRQNKRMAHGHKPDDHEDFVQTM